VGIPVAEALMRGGDISVVAVQLAVIVPIFNVAAVVILEGFGGRKPDIKAVLISVLKNPLIGASALGIAFLALKLRLPGVIDTVVTDMADVAGPLALFTLGAFFRFDTLGKYKRELVIVCTGRLLVIPAIFLSIGYLLGFRGADFAGLMGLFASCSAIASFIMAEQMGGDSELAGDIVVSTSVLCSFTLYFWAVLFMSLGAF
jgi:predicted permease